MSKQESLPKDWREGRRLRAWQLYRQGWKQKDIAAALGVTQGVVSQWIKKAKMQGVYALRHQPSPGRPPKLSKEQKATLPQQLSPGAESFGFRGQVWTSKRVASMIKKVMGISYHPGHYRRLLRTLKYSQQKPRKRATQRDEAAIQKWKEQRFEELKRKAEQEKRTIVFIDESAFYLLPMLVRTYAPCGQTPILSVKLTRDHLSVIGAITTKGRIFMQSQDHSYKGHDVVRFASPILANVYLHELDEKMQEIRTRYEQGGRQKRTNPLYRKLLSQKARLVKEGATRTKAFRELVQQIRSIPAVVVNDPTYIRIKYLRYADDVRHLTGY